MQSALDWLSSSSSSPGTAAAVSAEVAVAAAMPRCLQLMSARLQLSGQPPPLQSGPLAAPWAAPITEDGDDDLPASEPLPPSR